MRGPHAGERPDGPGRQGLEKNRLRPAMLDPAAPRPGEAPRLPAGVHPAARQQDPRKREGSPKVSAGSAGWPERSSMSSDRRRTDRAGTREARFGTRRCANTRNRQLFAIRRSRLNRRSGAQPIQAAPVVHQAVPFRPLGGVPHRVRRDLRQGKAQNSRRVLWSSMSAHRHVCAP